MFTNETVDIAEAVGRMEELLHAVEKGHWIVITRGDVPMAVLVPPPHHSGPARVRAG